MTDRLQEAEGGLLERRLSTRPPDEPCKIADSLANCRTITTQIH